MPRKTREEYLHSKERPLSIEEIRGNPEQAGLIRLTLMMEIMKLYNENQNLERKLAKMNEIISAQIGHLDPDEQ